MKMNMSIRASDLKIEPMEFLKKFLEKSSILRQMYRDYRDLNLIAVRSNALGSALKDNERGCSCEELDTVAEIITGIPSHQSVIKKAGELNAQAKENTYSYAKNMVRYYNDFLQDASKYLGSIIPNRTVISDAAITNFVDDYPKFDLTETNDKLESSVLIEAGCKSVTELMDAFDEVCDKTVKTISKLQESCKALNQMEVSQEAVKTQFLSDASQLIDSVPWMVQHCLNCIKYRELLNTRLENKEE